MSRTLIIEQISKTLENMSNFSEALQGIAQHMNLEIVIAKKNKELNIVA